MTNKYKVTEFTINLSDLDLLVNEEDKEKRKKIADEVQKHEIE